MVIPNSADFQNALNKIFYENEKKGRPFVDVQAGDLHKLAGWDPVPKNQRMHSCCNIMRKNIIEELGDTELPGGPQKGNGSSLIIRYRLPREHVSRIQNEIIDTINSVSREGTVSVWDCPVCKGRGVESDLTGDQTCRACKGESRWKANIQSERLPICPRCKGKGTIAFDRSLPLGDKICPVCQGSGKIPPGYGKNFT